MTGGDRPPARAFAAVLLPALALATLFVTPFGIMLAVSFYHRVEGGFFAPAFEVANYARLATPFFARTLAFSLGLAGLAAILVVAAALPFTHALTRCARRIQVPILVFILAVLSLSEVIVGFAWSTLLSRTAGLSNVLVWLGLLERPRAWAPGFAALLIGLCYLAFPFTVLLLYPALSRLDPTLAEASRMLGASRLRTFFAVVVPIHRRAIVSTLLLAFVFNLGAFLLPQLLGRPQHWTVAVHITDQAILQSNLPFAAAMAVFLMTVSLVIIGSALRLGARSRLEP